MTLNIEQLRDRVALKFPNVEQVEESIIRFTKNAGTLPFAVYYFDITQDLPATQERLTKYQDRVIGRHYFEGRKSLQWSNYLYFVTTGDRLARSEVRQAKELIERDRSYARKFVIAEEDVDSVLTPPIIAPVDAGQRANVLSVWMERLGEVGLDRAIRSDDALPKRLALIESSARVPAASPKPPARNVEVGAAPFIRSLELKTFRNFPIQRSFAFGTVNLIFGPNASGKTSLLEAIELFYCGQNKRNPGSPSPYELIAVLGDGGTEKASSSRGLQAFRDRNLAWYGQSEVKTNYLYRSFAQFNQFFGLAHFASRQAVSSSYEVNFRYSIEDSSCLRSSGALLLDLDTLSTALGWPRQILSDVEIVHSEGQRTCVLSEADDRLLHLLDVRELQRYAIA